LDSLLAREETREATNSTNEKATEGKGVVEPPIGALLSFISLAPLSEGPEIGKEDFLGS
jgi:hypothetical protein